MLKTAKTDLNEPDPFGEGPQNGVNLALERAKPTLKEKKIENAKNELL